MSNIKSINNLENKREIGEKNVTGEKRVTEEKRVDPSKGEKSEPAAVYEKSQPEDKTYAYDRASVERLKKESDNVQGQLKQMVADMLRRQGSSLDLLKAGLNIKVDDTARAEANKLIGPDGPLGVEAMSDTIVNFAKAVSGGDKGKLDTLIGAIDKGFREAERILGGLPEISQQTYSRIMEKLDDWKNE